MIKIGIIGTENSHATSFAKGLNLLDEKGHYLYNDMRVTKIWGDSESAQKLQKDANVLQIANSAEDFDDCDAIMITARRGSDHYRYALPYIKKGIPVFIDKPFTICEDEAAELIALAKESGSLISGGSACRYAQKVDELAASAKEIRAKGELISASMNFGIYMDIEYDGFYFYASHLVEMCTVIFGTDIKSITAHRNGKSVIAIVSYADISVSLHFTGGAGKYGCTLYAKHEIISQPITIEGIFDAELKVFAEMVINRTQPEPLESFVYPVRVMNAIKESYESGKTVVLAD